MLPRGYPLLPRGYPLLPWRCGCGAQLRDPQRVFLFVTKMATPEVLLARKLASNDLRTRQASETELKKWLHVKGKKGMKEIEMRRLWKGLFACMFMSDKPLVQVSRIASHMTHKNII